MFGAYSYSYSEAFGYRFKDGELLKTAFTHSSYANTYGGKSYERLEFLGDSVLDLIVAEYLYKTYPQKDEGVLTKMKARCVSKNALASVAKKHGLDMKIRRAGCEISDGMMEDTVEAVVAAIYLDGGMEAAKKAVMTFLPSRIKELNAGGELDEYTRGIAVENANTNSKQTNYKGLLQECIQKIMKTPQQTSVKYKVEDQTGPDHCKSFHVACYIDYKRCGSGDGSRIKDAEQNAAENTLAKLRIVKK